MAFCKYSIDMLANNTTAVDNIFINNYLPYADPIHSKVYLYGLYKCQSGDSKDNTLENFANELNLSQEQVAESFIYWQTQGLIQILDIEPFEVRYLPISGIQHDDELYDSNRYQSFNAQAQELLSGRMITPNEYREYYDIVKRLHMEESALLMIINYCVQTQGNKIGYHYITTVAKKMIFENITTAKQVEKKFLELESMQSEINEIKNALGIKHPLSVEEKSLYQKWINQGFKISVLKYVAESIKLKGKSSFLYMDALLEKYYSLKLFSENEISLYNAEKSKAKNIAKNITRNLGLYYENLEPVVDNYIWKWLNLGFSEKMLEEVSNYCFKNADRSLEIMNSRLEEFRNMGILSETSLKEYLGECLNLDNKIKIILKKLGVSRNVNQFDRDKYKVWKEIWQMSDELIDYACTLSIGKDQPMQYLSSVLSSFHDKNISRVEEAKQSFDIVSYSTKKTSASTKRKQTNEKVSSLVHSIKEVEI